MDRNTPFPVDFRTLAKHHTTLVNLRPHRRRPSRHIGVTHRRQRSYVDPLFDEDVDYVTELLEAERGTWSLGGVAELEVLFWYHKIIWKFRLRVWSDNVSIIGLELGTRAMIDFSGHISPAKLCKCLNAHHGTIVATAAGNERK